MEGDQDQRYYDRKYPGVVNMKGLMFECTFLTTGSLGFSYRTYKFAKLGKNPTLPSVIATVCLLVLMKKTDILSDLFIHRQKYPELYPDLKTPPQ